MCDSVLNLVNTSVSLMSCSLLIIYIVSVTVELVNAKDNQKHVHCFWDLFHITDQQRSAYAINHHKKPNNTGNSKSYHTIAEWFFSPALPGLKMSCALLSAGYTGFLAHSNEEAGAGSMAAKSGQLQLRPFFFVTSDLMNDNFCVTLVPCQSKCFCRDNTTMSTHTHWQTHWQTHCQKPFVIWKTDNRRNGNTENNYTLAWLQPLPEESIHIQPCYPSFPSAIFIMQWWGLGACSVLYLQAETTGELEERSSV